MRTFGIMLRILQQFKHDKRTIALMIFAPLMVLSLFFMIFNGTAYHPGIALVSPPPGMIEKFERLEAEVTSSSLADAQQRIASSEIDGYIDFSLGQPVVFLEGSDMNKKQIALMTIQQALQNTNSASPQEALEIEYIYGSADLGKFDDMGPVLIGIFVFFFTFLISGISFLRERTSGTLERLFVSPVRRWEVMCGYLLGFGVFSMIQSTIISLFSIYVLGIPLAGSLFNLILITVLMAVCALTIGTLVSSFAENELQVMQFIPIIIVPQVLFSGLFQIETMSPFLQWVSWFMPIFYGAEAMRDVMIRGNGWSEIYVNVSILFTITLFLVIVNIQVLKKYRNI